MQTTSDRINQRMRDLGLQHKDLVAATGASKGTVTNWISGVNNPTGKRLVQLAQALKTTSSWLLTGNSTPEFTQVEPWDSNTPLDDDEIEIPFFKDFSFACGGGSIGEAIANETRKLRMSKATLRNLSIMKENAVAATAIGDSMSPTVKDGDTIHVDLGRKNIKDGKIFVICIGQSSCHEGMGKCRGYLSWHLKSWTINLFFCIMVSGQWGPFFIDACAFY